MKYALFFVIFFWLSLFLVACNREEISFDPPTQALKFSADTVFCDTVYSQARSETYAVKIYNTENKDIKIPRISLKKGTTSLYRINVDGRPGTNFSDVPLRKKDSLYVFVEIAPVANAPEAIGEDQIEIESPAGKQHITLFSVVQDAEYFIESKQNPNILNQNTVWNNDKVKVIFGNLTLAEGKTLTINKGTKIYFHKNSGLNISKNATLAVNGDLGNEVTFRGDRSDTKYDTIPVNWNSIEVAPNANLTLNYAKIFGGKSGLKLTQANATIKNTIIHTFLDFGIHAVNSKIEAQNLVMNNCGQADIGIFKGGNYDFVHCTLAAYKNFDSGTLPFYALYATNEFINAKNGTENGSLNLSLKNSVLYGDNDNSIVFKPISGQTFSYSILNSLFKYKEAVAGFTFQGNPNILNSIINQDPKFENFFTQKLNLRLKKDSPARGKGDITVAASVPLDLLKNSRITNPTMGAYQ